MFTRNMKVSISPMSAWNFSGENTQVADADRERDAGEEDRGAGDVQRRQVRIVHVVAALQVLLHAAEQVDAVVDADARAERDHRAAC